MKADAFASRAKEALHSTAKLEERAATNAPPVARRFIPTFDPSTS
jgi:hypothetical protein